MNSIPLSTNIQIFNEKMCISTSKNQKDILLWAENSGTVAFTYTDDNLRTFIPSSKLKVIGSSLYSEYFIYLHDNKSMFTIYNTSSSQFHSKFTISDERISSFDLSDDSTLWLVGTMTGYLYVYNVMQGIWVKTLQLSKSEIYKVVYHKGFVLVLDKAKWSVYLFGSFLNTQDVAGKKEMAVFYNSENDHYDHMIVEDDFIVLYNTSNIILLKLSLDQTGKYELIPMKLFKIENESIYDLKLNSVELDLFFTNWKKEIYCWQTKSYNDNEKHQVKIDKNNMILLPLDMKNPPGNITWFEFGTKNILWVGHEDGKVTQWSRKGNNWYYSNDKVFGLHKGAVTNWLLINKPISQYGLNFNKKINDSIISPTQTRELKEVLVKGNERYCNYVSDYWDEYINNNIVNALISEAAKIKRNEIVDDDIDIEMNIKDDKDDDEGKHEEDREEEVKVKPGKASKQGKGKPTGKRNTKKH